MWRPTGARLSLDAEWREVRAPPRGSIPDRPDETCFDPVGNYKEASEFFKTHLHCIDDAIDHFGRYARSDPRALNDVAVAYYTRAKLQDRPTDLFNALQIADEAVRATRGSAASRFNQALFREELGLHIDALQSWNELVRIETNDKWLTEERRHVQKLQRRSETSAAHAGLEQFEETLLPDWAASPSPQKLASLKQQAQELSAQLNGDRLAPDIVAALSHPDARKGILEFQQGLGVRGSEAVPHFRKSSELLANARNPLRLVADMKRADEDSIESDIPAAIDLLTRLEEEATRAGYRQLRGRIRATRAMILSFASRYVDALRDYELAADDYTAVHDHTALAKLRTNQTGVYRFTGHYDLAARTALADTRAATDPEKRHAQLGELSELALELGHPQIALLYQNEAVDIARRQGIPSYRVTALRKRADILRHLNRNEEASRDLESARILLGEDDSSDISRLLRSGYLEVAGRLVLEPDPRRTIEAFTQAIDITKGDFLTLRARLYAQRAEAYTRIDDTATAIEDLRTAIRILREEEQNILARRTTKSDELWSTYFSRFAETWRALIEKLIEQHDYDGAFEYVEKERAFEPLMLVLARQRLHIPRAFRDPDAPGTIDAIRQSLEPGTFLIQYYVADTRTYTWVISRDGFEVLTQGTSAAQIANWTEEIQRAAIRNDSDALETRLGAPFGGLLSAPLARIDRRRGDRPLNRLVIVPDPSMYGLPFAALRDAAAQRYLVELAPVQIADSSALYLAALELDRRVPKSDPPSILLFGNPRFDRKLDIAQKLDDLPGAEDEVRRVGAVYGAAAEIRTNAAATVPEFLRLAPQYDVLHLAAHGIVMPNEPTESLILLAPSPGDAGALTAARLLDELKLRHTRLVVLSSCNSAGGYPVGRGGVAPLVRPLIAAGVPAVIGSLWNVEDATTPDLLVSFHDAWRSGDDAATALRHAQLAAIAKDTSPLVWAPFQVTGHASSPKESSR